MKKIVIDAVDKQITINFPLQRIVSLVPSITELLFDLGLDDKIVGVTKFCIHPAEKTKTVQKIGGTKDFDISEILKLQPGLVIANKEENQKDTVLKLTESVPVYVTDVFDIPSALTMINQIGEITDTLPEAKKIVGEIDAGFLQNFDTPKKIKKAVYLIWRKPYMTINGRTFINHMMQKAGYQNVFAWKKDNYPVITDDEIKNSGAEVVLLSSEPYRFKEKHSSEFQNFLPDAEIRLVDGEMFTWFGSRMRLAAKYFYKL
ncbi:MAG: ABC transporter substrate-binding protein [Bacteroidales bacterium]|nr:ABC transporter substrate-binding protein [Bacteroidales bacterium]